MELSSQSTNNGTEEVGLRLRRTRRTDAQAENALVERDEEEANAARRESQEGTADGTTQGTFEPITAATINGPTSPAGAAPNPPSQPPRQFQTAPNEIANSTLLNILADDFVNIYSSTPAPAPPLPHFMLPLTNRQLIRPPALIRQFHFISASFFGCLSLFSLVMLTLEPKPICSVLSMVFATIHAITRMVQAYCSWVVANNVPTDAFRYNRAAQRKWGFRTTLKLDFWGIY